MVENSADVALIQEKLAEIQKGIAAVAAQLGINQPSPPQSDADRIVNTLNDASSRVMAKFAAKVASLDGVMEEKIQAYERQLNEAIDGIAE